MKYKCAIIALMICFITVGCSISPRVSKVEQFERKYDSVAIGMTLQETLTVLDLGRHEIREIEHPDGRLIHTKLYLHTIDTPQNSVTWKFKTDRNGIITEKKKEQTSNQ
jgi:hypothetical protein